MKDKREPVMLTYREASSAIRLLAELQKHLEGFIQSVLLPGETVPANETDTLNLRRDQRNWSAAEELIRRLSGHPSTREIP
jgi:hypothetical protein